jgi:polar amino acid transport system substrate-binding protein
LARIRRAAAGLLVLAALLLSLTGCGSSKGGYRIIETLREETFSMAFRQGDMVGQYVTAALKVLAADGTVHSLALEWFGEDNTSFPEDAEALDAFGDIPARTMILGLDPGAWPMSYADGGSYSGFDVELARAVCLLLGWEIQYQPMDEMNAYTELSSGNVDVAWGGMSFEADGNGADLDLGPAYLENKILAVTTSDGPGSLRSLSGQRLALPLSGRYSQILAENGSLSAMERVTKLADGNEACFAALDAGECDGILVDSVALDAKTK